MTTPFACCDYHEYPSSLTLDAKGLQSMASPQNTFLEKPQSEEPQEYEKAEGLLTHPPNVLQEPQRATLGGGTCTRTITANSCLYDRFAGRRQRSYSTPASPFRSFSALSNPYASIYPNIARPAHEDIALGRAESMASSTEVNDSNINYVPVTPAHIMSKKYRRRYFIPQSHGKELPIIRALQPKFASATVYGPATSKFQWQTCEAPEGNIYFRDIFTNILTFVDLFNEKYRNGVCACASMLLNEISRNKLDIPKNSEIVVMLEDYEDDKGYGYGYYLASWEERRVFWLEDVKYEFVTQEARVCLTESHIAKLIEQQFWYENGLDFNGLSSIVPSSIIQQLKKVINLGLYDQITSDNSIFPYDKTEASDILKCLDRVELLEERQDVNDVWVVARCKQSIEEYRFLNYHGERGARIHRFDSVQKGTIRGGRSILFQILTPLLFFMPSVYMKELEGLWIDETVDWISWRRFVSILDKDWNQSMTPATVILSANIGFLAIGSIDHDNNNAHRNAAQIASYISSVLSFFFFVTVQILSHQHRTSHHYTADRACAFLERRSQQWLGLESVAITYSLPTSLFIWSMLTLLAALMIVFFWGTDAVTRIIMSIAVAVLLGVTVILLWLDWGHLTAYRSEYDPEPQHRPILGMLSNLRGFKGIASSVQNQWREKGVFRLRRLQTQDRSTHSIVSQGSSSVTASVTAVTDSDNSEKFV